MGAMAQSEYLPLKVLTIAVIESGAPRYMPTLPAAAAVNRSGHVCSWVVPTLLSVNRIVFRFCSTAFASGVLTLAFLPSADTGELPRENSDAVKCQPPVLPAEYSEYPATPGTLLAIALAAVATSCHVVGGLFGSRPAWVNRVLL